MMAIEEQLDARNLMIDENRLLQFVDTLVKKSTRGLNLTREELEEWKQEAKAAPLLTAVDSFLRSGRGRIDTLREYVAVNVNSKLTWLKGQWRRERARFVPLEYEESDRVVAPRSVNPSPSLHWDVAFVEAVGEVQEALFEMSSCDHPFFNIYKAERSRSRRRVANACAPYPPQLLIPVTRRRGSVPAASSNGRKKRLIAAAKARLGAAMLKMFDEAKLTAHETEAILIIDGLGMTPTQASQLLARGPRNVRKRRQLGREKLILHCRHKGIEDLSL